MVNFDDLFFLNPLSKYSACVLSVYRSSADGVNDVLLGSDSQELDEPSQFSVAGMFTVWNLQKADLTSSDDLEVDQTFHSTLSPGMSPTCRFDPENMFPSTSSLEVIKMEAKFPKIDISILNYMNLSSSSVSNKS